MTEPKVEVTYIEDLCKTQFVLSVTQGTRQWLEQRRANPSPNGLEYEYDKVSGSMTPSERYDYLAERSTLKATAVPTARWTDRKWIPVTPK